MPRVNVTAVPTRVFVASSGEREVRLRNDLAVAVDVGHDAQVVTGAGFSLAAGAEDEYQLEPGQELWVVAPAAQSGNVEVL